MCGQVKQEHRRPNVGPETMQDWGQCHSVLAAASCDPKEQLYLLLVSEMFMTSLNKHRNPCLLLASGVWGHRVKSILGKIDGEQMNGVHSPRTALLRGSIWAEGPVTV